MDERRDLPGTADLNTLSTPALRELLRRDLRENLLDTAAACRAAEILKTRREQEDPDGCPSIDLEWKSFRENYISLKARCRRFARRVLPKLLILAAVAAALVLALWLGTRPVISESILETVSCADGHFVMKDIRPGMTGAELTDQLRQRHLRYTEADASGYSYAGMYLRPDPAEDLRGVSWINLARETRVTELGNATVRRTYYFRYDTLEFVELETDRAAGDISGEITRCAALVSVLESAFGPPDEGDAASLYTRGEHVLTWNGTEGSRLELVTRYYVESAPAGTARTDGQTETRTWQTVIRFTP